jgi:hypothetical protein
MGRLTAPVRFVLALLLLAGAGTVRAEESWIKVTAGHYTAYSRQDEAHTLRWLADFDRFIDGAAGLLGIDTGQLSPLTLVIFADEAELHPYLPRNADGHARTYTRAVFAQGRGRAIAALAATPGDSAARRLLFHEGAHWLLAHAPADRIPAWLDEGVAQLLATAEPDEHGLRWGAPEAAMLRFARLPAVRLLTPSTVVTAHRDDPLFDTGPGAGAFYAQAWALVHSLLLDGEGLAGGLDAETLSALAAAGPDELARRLGLRSPDALDRRRRRKWPPRAADSRCSRVRPDRGRSWPRPVRRRCRCVERRRSGEARSERSVRVARVLREALDDVPVLGHLAVLDAEDVDHRLAVRRQPVLAQQVQDDVVALGDHALDLVGVVREVALELPRERGDALEAVLGVRTVLDVGLAHVAARGLRVLPADHLLVELEHQALVACEAAAFGGERVVGGAARDLARGFLRRSLPRGGLPRGRTPGAGGSLLLLACGH